MGKHFCCSSGLCVSSIKTGTRCIMRSDELPFVVRRSRRISKERSSRRIRDRSLFIDRGGGGGGLVQIRGGSPLFMQKFKGGGGGTRKHANV